MKKVFIYGINIYQNVISYLLKNILGVSHFCRFRPTCSEYARISIEREGVIKGTYMAFVRILKCQPLYKGI